jgi:hypothetical protein
MNLKMSLLALILPALILYASCTKNAATTPTSHGQITGQWQWQYTTSPGNIGYALPDSTVQIVFASDSASHTNTFTLWLNNSERANGTWQWQDSILVLTSSAPINDADYAQDNIFNGTNPSEYFVKVSQDSLYLSKNFIIPGATGPYSTPIEPQVSVFIYRLNPGGLNTPAN